MVRLSSSFAALALALIPAVLAFPLERRQDASQTLTVKSTPKVDSKFGIAAFIETNINYGTDGGIYAELIRNRAFQEGGDHVGDGTLEFWHSIGDASLTLTTDDPLSNALPQSVIVKGTSSSSDNYGLRNKGFFGIPVQQQAYDVTFYVRANSSFNADFTAGLYSNDSSSTFAEAKQTVGVTDQWQQIKVTLNCDQSSQALENTFGLTLAKGTEDVQLNLISLFPPTWKGTVGRQDLSQALADLKPVTFRLPGGNDLEGNNLTSYQKWNATVGPIVDRPGRPPTWAGWNTEGYGLNEAYSIFSQMGATPILGIFAGYTLDEHSVPKDKLQPYVDSAIEELHYFFDAEGSSDLAKKRVSDGGSPTPWTGLQVQVGNEDWISRSAQNSYHYRYPAFTDAIKKDFGESIEIISSSPYIEPKSSLEAIDQHDYNTPQNLISRWNERDVWPRNGTMVDELEFSMLNNGRCGQANDTDLYSDSCRLDRPTMQSAVAEATFMMGLERNGDITPSAAYAPLFMNARSSQWSPDLIEFDILNVVKSPSYWTQFAFGNNRIASIHDVQSSDQPGPVYWSVGTLSDGQYSVKLTNIASSAKTVAVTLDQGTFASASGQLWYIANDNLDATNTIGNPDNVTPQTRALGQADFASGTLQISLPPHSFTVATLQSA